VRPPLDRLAEHTTYDPLTGCLVCDLATVRGYPMIKWRGRSWRVARLAYRLLVGDPGELQIDHTCRNTRCWNLAHLEAVTCAVNIQRERDSRTRCRHGHPVSAWRVRRRDGKRECAICARTRDREAKRRARDLVRD
jgi:hypothetical protein